MRNRGLSEKVPHESGVANSMVYPSVNKLLFFVPIVLLLASCMSAPEIAAPAPTQVVVEAPTVPVTLPPTTAPAPTVPLTVPPTTAPAPTQAPPTATSAPTAAPQPATSFFVYPKSDGSLWRVDGPGHAPINLAD